MDFFYRSGSMLFGINKAPGEKYLIPDDDFEVIREVAIDGKQISEQETDSSNFEHSLVKMNLRMRREGKENNEDSNKISKNILAKMRSCLEKWEKRTEKLKKECSNFSSKFEEDKKQDEDILEENMPKNKAPKGKILY